MHNVAYLFSLLPWFVRAGLDSVLCRKVANQMHMCRVALDPLDACMFCFVCCRASIPTVTAKLRLTNGTLTVECLACGTKGAASIRAPDKDTIKRVSTAASLKEFLV